MVDFCRPGYIYYTYSNATIHITYIHSSIIYSADSMHNYYSYLSYVASYMYAYVVVTPILPIVVSCTS